MVSHIVAADLNRPLKNEATGFHRVRPPSG